jgi:hypothetical protein
MFGSRLRPSSLDTPEKTRKLSPQYAITIAALVLGLTAHANPARAQQLVSDNAIPDAPSAVAQAQSQQTPTANTPNGPVSPATGEPKQTKRILGVIPNFRAVSADQTLPPQSVKEKFISTTQQSFDYSSFILPAVLAAYAQGENSDPQFHQGAAGYGRYFWHAFVDQTSENYFVQAILPSVTHEDSRYYTLGHGGFIKRGAYGFSRIFITRTDKDTETFNFSEIVGAGAAAGISDLYYPSSDRTWTKTGQKWFLNVGIDGGTFLFQEFWPNINNALFHQKD